MEKENQRITGLLNADKFGHKSEEHEQFRRKIQTGLHEFRNTVADKLTNLKAVSQSNLSFASKLDETFAELEEQYKVLYANVKNFGEADGAEEWRASELGAMSRIMQKRFAQLQNPSNCSATKKLVCSLNKACGFGCQLHHMTYCFIVAYNTNRTLVVVSDGWQYSKEGWEHVFQAVGKCPFVEKLSDPDVTPFNTFANQTNIEVLYLPIVEYLTTTPSYMPLCFPADISRKLLHLHSNPPAWWLGQVLLYLMKYKPLVEHDIQKYSNHLLRQPYIGIHIRRSDKIGTEAAYHQVDEYMTQVENWYLVTEAQSVKSATLQRIIYLATDDSTVVDEITKKYPEYTVITNILSAVEAENVSSRYSETSLVNLIVDIHFLSRSNFIVCTFSSQVCRVAYELMQGVFKGDAGNNFRSLDDIYYFGGQLAHEHVALFDHQAKSADEIDLMVGDVIVTYGNHWNGYSKGLNTRTKETGLYPNFKIEEKWRIC